MKAHERAEGFVTRADSALGDPENTLQRWDETIRSKTDERLVHSFPASIDRAVRRLPGPYEHWDACQPEDVKRVAEQEAVQVLRMLSAHPSGWVRQSAVEQMETLDFNLVAPHLANRSLDFVPAVRDLAQPILRAALLSLHEARQEATATDALLGTANMAIARLMRPRAASLCPDIVELCITLGKTSVGDRPGRFSPRVDPFMALTPFRQALEGASSEAERHALEAMIEYLDS